MNIEVQLYVSGIKEFFNRNPNELYNLIPKGYEDEFYEEIAIMSEVNYEKIGDAALTKEQMLEICVKINNVERDSKNTFPFLKTKYGDICLN